MNNKEKIQFFASKEYLENLHEYNLDYQNHNILFWVHFASLLFTTTGVAEINLDLDYSFVFFDGKDGKKDKGLTFSSNGISLFSTSRGLIQLNNRCCNKSDSFKNYLFSIRGTRKLREIIQKYLNENLIFDDLTSEQFPKTTFQKVFLKFKIKNRNSDDTQKDFLNLIENNCPQVNYFINYIQMKKNVPITSNPIKKHKI